MNMEDTISSGCMMYPVFCTANIPAEILDELILESHKGLEFIGGAGALYIIETNQLSVEHGSRPPMKAFDSPYFGNSLEDVYGSYQRCVVPQDYFTSHSFAILDEKTAKEKTVLLASDNDGALHTVRSDFWSSLNNLVAFEMETLTVKEAGIGANAVIIRRLEEEQKGKHEARQS